MSDLLTEHFMIYHIEDPEFQGQKFTIIVFRALTYDHTPVTLNIYKGIYSSPTL
jgi:hypothetical protein